MIIDLSVALDEDTPVYPGDPKVQISPSGTLAKDGYTDHSFCLNTHVGTHIDAPSHMVEGKSLGQIPIDQFIGPGKCIDATQEFSLQAVKAAEIKPDDIVLFCTGKIKNYNNPDYFEDYKDLPEEIANYLVKQQVKAVGFDMCGPDHPPFPIHRLLLSNSILIIENLTNLEQLINKKFTIHALPIKLALDGAPARVIATL